MLFFRITLALRLTQDKNRSLYLLYFFCLLPLIPVCLAVCLLTYLHICLFACHLSVCLPIYTLVCFTTSGSRPNFSSLSPPLFACLCLPLCFSVLPFPPLFTTPSVYRRFSLCLFFAFCPSFPSSLLVLFPHLSHLFVLHVLSLGNEHPTRADRQRRLPRSQQWHQILNTSQAGVSSNMSYI